MMERDPEDIILEVDYWTQVLAALADLNTLVLEASTVVIDATPPLLVLAMLVNTEADADAVGKISRGTTATLGVIRRMQTPLDALLELARGRNTVLAAELAALTGSDHAS